jgi:hypothetical protein
VWELQARGLLHVHPVLGYATLLQKAGARAYLARLARMESIVSGGTQVLIPPDSGLKERPRSGWTGGLYDHMRRVLATEHGKAIYRQRKQTVEPVFGHTRHNRKIDRCQRRGRAAALSEWRLIAATHNLQKLHSHQIATATS